MRWRWTRRRLLHRVVRHRDGRDEPVAALRHGLDVGLVVVGGTERAPERKHVLREVRFLDERVGPDLFEELLLVGQPSGAAHEGHQRVECLRRKRDRRAVAQQAALGRNQPVRPERV